MPCPSSGLAAAEGEVVRDLLDFHPQPATVYRPRNRAELVAAVLAAVPGQSFRAVGSVWSPSEASLSDCVIRTEDLDHHLSQPWPGAFARLDDMRVRQPASGSGVLESFARDAQGDPGANPPPENAGPPLIWVEAGIKIRHLLKDLEECGLCLPTMGAGAGQSLAGVLSTSTHGGDFEVPPLSSWVRALHVVGEDGQEWFVSDARSSITIDQLAADPNWCPDARLVKDDDLLDALRVSVGRFGAIYAVVLEVVPQYAMLEVTSTENWASLRPLLSSSGRVGEGVFACPVTTAATGWLAETLVAPLDRQIAGYDAQQADQRNVGGLQGQGAEDPWEAEVRTRRKSFLGLDDVVDDAGRSVLAQGEHALTHLNVVIALGRPVPRTWVQRRWRVPVPAQQSQILPKAPHGEISTAVIDAGTNGSAMIPVLRKQFDPGAKAHDEHDVLNLSAYKDIVGSQVLAWFRDEVIPRCSTPARSGADALMLTLYTALNTEWRVIGQDLTKKVAEPLRDAIDGAIGIGLGIHLSAACAEQQWVPQVRLGWATRMLDTHDYELDYLQSGHTCEFHFDASGTDYLAFLDDVVVAAAAAKGALGLIGLRYTPRARAQLAMQQWDLTASVEVQLGRIRHDDVMGPLCEQVRALGSAHGGIPHWGQECESVPPEVLADRFPHINDWRRALGAVAPADRGVFSTPFSRRVGLEPSAPAPLTAVAASTDLAAVAALAAI